MKTFNQFIKEQQYSGAWKHDQQKFFDQIGLTDRFRRDPVARLGYEVVKDPKSGVLDAIKPNNDDMNYKTGIGTAGKFEYVPYGGNVRSLNVAHSPKRTYDSSGSETMNPSIDPEAYGDTLAHELGHVGSLYTQGIMTGKRSADLEDRRSQNEIEQRYRDLENTKTGADQFNQSSSYIAKNKYHTPVKDYDEYADFAKQIMDKGYPDNYADIKQSAMQNLNDPETLKKFRQDYFKTKVQESKIELVKRVIQELSVPLGTTGKRGKVSTPMVAIRMASGKIEKHPPGKSGSSGGGGSDE